MNTVKFDLMRVLVGQNVLIDGVHRTLDGVEFSSLDGMFTFHLKEKASTETPEEKESLDAIEQVEWKNGDIVNTPDGEGCIVAEVYRDGYSYWIVQFKDNFHEFDPSEISEPETTKVKEEREDFITAAMKIGKKGGYRK